MDNIGECLSSKERQQFCHLKVCTFYSRRFCVSYTTPRIFNGAPALIFVQRVWGPKGDSECLIIGKGRMGRCVQPVSVSTVLNVPTCIANRCCLDFLSALGRALGGRNSSGHVSPTSWSRIVTWCYAIFTWQGRGGNLNHDCCLDIAQGFIWVLALKMCQRDSHIARKGILCSDASYNAEEETLGNRRWIADLSVDISLFHRVFFHFIK
jgi:hypothetical protein